MCRVFQAYGAPFVNHSTIGHPKKSRICLMTCSLPVSTGHMMISMPCVAGRQIIIHRSVCLFRDYF